MIASVAPSRLRGAGDVDRGVAAAVDDDAPAEHRRLLAFHRAQHRDRVEDVRRVLGRDERALGDVRADGEERGSEAAVLHRPRDVVDLGAEADRHAHVDDALHLGVEHVARQAVLGDAEAHHPAHQRAGLDHRDRVAEPAQVVGGRHPRGAGADDEHVLPGLDLRPRRSASGSSAPRRRGSARPS